MATAQRWHCGSSVDTPRGSADPDPFVQMSREEIRRVAITAHSRNCLSRLWRRRFANNRFVENGSANYLSTDCVTSPSCYVVGNLIARFA